MDIGMHLPQIDFNGEGLSWRRLIEAVRAARSAGYAAVSTNDHLHFARPWLDGLTALTAVVEESGFLELATTVALPVVRGPLPLAKALTALDVLSADPAELQRRICIGPAGHCAELLAAYKEAGCGRVYLWPVGDEPRQLRLIADEVLPRLGG